MDHFTYRDNELFCEDVALAQVAEQFQTPVYVYSKATLLHHYRGIAEAFALLDPLICYSVKSCGNVHICRLLAEAGAGMDVVSGGELFRALRAGVDADKIVYAGVGKTDQEIHEAIDAGIGWFNIESEMEFENIATIAEKLKKVAHGTLRVNPDVADPHTHAKTSTGKKQTKFGVDIDRALQFFEKYGGSTHCRLDAVHLHIGSPIYSSKPYVKAITKALALIEQLRSHGHIINAIDLGGGFAADYESGRSPSYAEYAEQIVPLLSGKGLRVILEPGRTIAGNAGVLINRVLYTKQGGEKRFVIIDSGFNHLLRPAMYDAFHFIWPVKVAPLHVPAQRKREMGLPELQRCDVVGPLCETGDVLAKDWRMPGVERGDLLCIFTAGAYGMAMASNYNAMPRPAEVLIDGEQVRLIRRRESYADLIATEDYL